MVLFTYVYTYRQISYLGSAGFDFGEHRYIDKNIRHVEAMYVYGPCINEPVLCEVRTNFEAMLLN
jgi:hypothetical protein